MTNYGRHWRAVQLETARWDGPYPHTFHPSRGCRALEVSEKLPWLTGKCLPKGEGWGHNETTQWPASPPWADADGSCLLSTFMDGLRMGTPRINTFSWDATPGKTKVSFEQWHYDVRCTKDHYPEVVV